MEKKIKKSAKTLQVDAPMPQNYEQALSELESLVTKMENNALSLEDSMQAYQRGSKLMSYCQECLEKAEQQVRVLEGETLKPLIKEPFSTDVKMDAKKDVNQGDENAS